MTTTWKWRICRNLVDCEDRLIQANDFALSREIAIAGFMFRNRNALPLAVEFMGIA